MIQPTDTFEHDQLGTLLLVPEIVAGKCYGCCVRAGLSCRVANEIRCAATHIICVRTLEDYAAMRVAFKLTGEL